MFIIKQSETFKAPVTVHVPGENGGTTKYSFTGIFRRLNQPEVETLQKEVNAGAVSDTEFARRVMCGWGEDVKQENGQDPLPFTDGTFSQMLEVVGAAGAIVTAWTDGMSGGARRKKLEEAAAFYIGRGLKPRVVDESDNDLAAFGIVSQEVEEPEKEVFEVWPENQSAVTMFVAASTQWRIGPGGITGLDYNVLFRLFELYDITDHRDTLEAVQVMENQALKIMGERTSHGND